jgi:Gly-Xaa carboxypeptidase
MHMQGAGEIAKYLEATYGHDSFAALLDEGGQSPYPSSKSTACFSKVNPSIIAGFGTTYGGDVLFAGPATGEKGYLDIRIEVNTPGGHSSIPPRHTVRPKPPFHASLFALPC